MLVKRLCEDAVLPTRGSEWSAGMDLYSVECKTIPPGCRELVDTGLQIQLAMGWSGLIWPRSGLAFKHGVDVLAGVVDADYRGSVGVVLINHGDDPVRVQKGDRIAQMIVQPVWSAAPVEVDELPGTDRSTSGWGSTGR